MSRLNWDALPADWNFSYSPSVIRHPYSGKVKVTAGSTQPIISGTIQPMVLTCQEDIDSLDQWFIDGEKLVRCPIFNKYPVTAGTYTSFYSAQDKAICWNDSPYSYSGGYFYGTNAAANEPIDPNQPCSFRLNIVPVNRGYRKYRPSLASPMQVDPIPFTVVPKPVSLSTAAPTVSLSADGLDQFFVFYLDGVYPFPITVNITETLLTGAITVPPYQFIVTNSLTVTIPANVLTWTSPYLPWITYPTAGRDDWQLDPGAGYNVGSPSTGTIYRFV